MPLNQQGLLETLKEIKERKAYVPATPETISWLRYIYKKIPFTGSIVTDLANSTADITKGSGVGQYIQVNAQIPAEVVQGAKGLAFVGIVAHIFNLARMGIVWYLAKRNGQQVAFNLTKKAKIIYSLTALTLAVLILAFAAFNPFVASVLAVASACLGLSVTISNISRSYWHRHQEKKELVFLDINLNRIEAQMLKIKQHLGQVQKLLESGGQLDEREQEAIQSKINHYNALFEAQKEQADRRHFILEQPKAKARRLRDKKIAIPLAIVAVVGAVIALSNPVLGLTIAGIGTAIAIGSVTTFYLLIPLGKWLYKKAANFYQSHRKDKEQPEAVAEAVAEAEAQIGSWKDDYVPTKNSSVSGIFDAGLKTEEPDEYDTEYFENKLFGPIPASENTGGSSLDVAQRNQGLSETTQTTTLGYS